MEGYVPCAAVAVSGVSANCGRGVSAQGGGMSAGGGGYHTEPQMPVETLTCRN